MGCINSKQGVNNLVVNANDKKPVSGPGHNHGVHELK